MRDVPSITLVNWLNELGAHIKAYDPVDAENCKKPYPELEIKYANNPEKLADWADALVLVTEWKEFLKLPYSQLGELMRHKIIIGGRNVLDRMD